VKGRRGIEIRTLVMRSGRMGYGWTRNPGGESMTIDPSVVLLYLANQLINQVVKL
jgi:hypothetical protein